MIINITNRESANVIKRVSSNLVHHIAIVGMEADHQCPLRHARPHIVHQTPLCSLIRVGIVQFPDFECMGFNILHLKHVRKPQPPADHPESHMLLIGPPTIADANARQVDEAASSDSGASLERIVG